MSRISKFDSEIHSEELFPFNEEEYSDVMAAPVEDEWGGYREWSAELEQSQFEASLEARATVQTPNGPQLIKRECSHSDCGFTCKRDTRIGGISI
jgi:hypothetical protein